MVASSRRHLLGWVMLGMAPVGVADTAPLGMVHELTGADFYQHVGDGSETPWLVKFYAPWCGHGKALEPVWKDLAMTLRGTAHVAKVDCISEAYLAQQFDVSSFPTITLVAEGRFYSFAGPRSPDAIEAFVRRGWRSSDGEVLFRDLPWRDRMEKVFFTFVTVHAIPISVIFVVAICAWMCCIGQPTEEQRQKRKAFEEKRDVLEQKWKEKKEAEREAAKEAKAKDAAAAGEKKAN